MRNHQAEMALEDVLYSTEKWPIKIKAAIIKFLGMRGCNDEKLIIIGGTAVNFGGRCLVGDRRFSNTGGPLREGECSDTEAGSTTPRPQ